ncbi:purine ribonucleoside efflux pump NepI [Klebsiella indica]|uniref:Purine ribonucleoside efflux pump NepI n=1 Tax=Klebsiella indica TaxID=2582917 RepID=A0A5R9LI20_9ENTR|nr:purine ribonucleoside efflux pump NepI [Klebsiella indica]TLV17810.1 purine ribonucleoside efflux pump NepI [Klebsiella indica]
MSTRIAEQSHAETIIRPNWSAVFAVAFCVACLITVEFLPVSLLTPMAQDLGISEGVAGQSVTVTAFVAMFASLFITQIIQATDRRYVVILFAVLLTLSCLLVSFATSFTLLLAGRACLGLALGGFWAMSASLTMRLVPPRTVPKALSVIFGAVSIALVIAAPLGSFLGGIIGWRHVFNAAAVMGVLCVIWVVKSLPSLPGEPSHQKQNIFSLLQRPGVMAGMIAIFMSFAGQFAFFTYIRPVYMNLAGFDVDGLTLVLLSFGIASFVGTSLSSSVLKRSVKLALAGAPLVLAVSALVLTLWGREKVVAAGIAIVWGLSFALVPVGWSTWITRSLSDQAEKAGSIQVAVIQLANTCGAAIGGVALDHLGLLSPLALSGTLMLLAGILVVMKVRV